MDLKKWMIPALFLMLLLHASVASAQRNNDYDSLWKKVEQFQKKGLTRSAQATVKEIYGRAKKDDNASQIIKSLIYKITFQEFLEEGMVPKIFDTLKLEIQSTPEPGKSILESITAQLYWQYFQNYRYKIYNRTRTQEFQKEDITTWTSEDFQEKISELYLASLRPEKLLKNALPDDFEAIIRKGNATYLRPTLYDLLAHRALGYFSGDENNISRPAYAYEIKNDTTFAPAAVFSKAQFPTTDSTSVHHKALLIFQDLISMHLQEPKALIAVDLERLEFVHRYAVMPDKDSLYIQSLRKLYKKYDHEPAAADAGYAWANAVYSNAKAQENSSFKTPQYSLVAAKNILQSVIQKYPESQGGKLSKNLLSQILEPNISLETEKVDVPGIPFRRLVSYKNTHKLYLRLVGLTPDLEKKLESGKNNNEKIGEIISFPILRSWVQDVPQYNDYQTHSVEIKVDALAVGKYLLVASADKSFSVSNNPLSAQTFYVSNISYVNRGKEYFVLDRNTGQPLTDARVVLWRQKYDTKNREYQLQQFQTFTTDKHGYFQIDSEQNDPTNRNFRLEISYKKDHLFLDDFQYNYFNSFNSNEDTSRSQHEYDKKYARIFLFTDRSIYRPGQVIYFKGIGVTRNPKTNFSELLKIKDSLTVSFLDANNQKIDSLQVSLNDFGSFKGKFNIPEGRMNGIFRIMVSEYNNSTTGISVEEYKRPKFFASFEKPTGSYRVGDTIKLKGLAKAYAGNNISDARVTYRVTRQARFLYPWMFWRRGFPRVKPLEITHGELNTDSDGEFFISFKAIPDLSIDQKTMPVFDYEVGADITDINGETRSANMTIRAGYTSLTLNIEEPTVETIMKDSLSKIKIKAANLSGTPQTVEVKTKIYRLQPPNRLIRPRMWEQPDTFVLSKKEYIHYFPYDEYKDELKKESWPRTKLVFSASDSTRPGNSIDLSKTKLAAGWYVVEASAMDAYGAEVKDIKYFQIYDPKVNKSPDHEFLFTSMQSKDYEPGESATLRLNTAAPNVFLIQQVNSVSPKNEMEEGTYRYFQINHSGKIFSFPIEEKDRGGFGITNFFIKHNRFYSSSPTVHVPWDNKKLNISFDTYRDKMLPGSKEQWKVTIKGNKGQKVAAEMLAGMYDQSLDQFKPHTWQMPNLWPVYYGSLPWNSIQNFSTTNSFQNYWTIPRETIEPIVYDAIKYIPGFYSEVYYRREAKAAPGINMDHALNQVVVSGVNRTPVADSESTQDITLPELEANTPVIPKTPEQISIRKNFQETAFFFPQLQTDSSGNISFSFTMPEALTQWKLMTLAHTRSLAMGYAEKSVVTQKELMVQPNAPRFLREGDHFVFSAKIVNLSDKEMKGTVNLQMLNATTLHPVDKWFGLDNNSQDFEAAAGQSVPVTFSMQIPKGFNDAVVYRIIARTNTHSDGEEAAIPVVTNRMLVTESLTLPMRGSGTKNFTFEKLKQSNTSNTLTNYGLTVEYTPNPAWYAVQALPYLSDYPYECVEQTFNRYFANALAMSISNASPRLKQLFEQWKTKDTTALLSNLEKNEELKSILLQETPWVLQAKSESEQKRNIALLFDMTKMGSQLNSALQKVIQMQLPSGAFSWFKGGRDDRYITQYIISEIGHLKKINAIPENNDAQLMSIANKALVYLDEQIEEDYKNLLDRKVNLKQNNLSSIQIQYLYLRSFFPKNNPAKESETAHSYYLNQVKKYWLDNSRYMQGMIALILDRTGDKTTAMDIIRSLKENAIYNPELGMYWKEWNHPGYWWYQAPIESQSLMIEAFTEITGDEKTIGELKTWLLKNKQTNHWNTTRATAEACYALLLQGTDWLNSDKQVVIKLGNTIFNNKDEKQEAGTGYFKRRIDGSMIKPSMGNISITVSQPEEKANNTPSWGAVYWQYFEDLDKITFAETPLQISKKLFKETLTDRGPVLTPVNKGDTLQVGDKIKIRIVLRVDRDMEYVQMKDMIASCMEPVNVISTYKWQGGLGYYESTKDASTNFFFSRLTKGTYVFEYPVFVSNAGNFSNGITTIQCMYAPEFTAHSEGVRVTVK